MIEDGVTDGNQTVSITAAASGYCLPHRFLVVTDRNLPDLVVSKLTVPPAELPAMWFPSHSAWRIGDLPQTPCISTISQPSESLCSAEAPRRTTPWRNRPCLLRFLTRPPTSSQTKPGSYWIVRKADAARQVEELVEGNNILISESPVVSGASLHRHRIRPTRVALCQRR